MTAKIKRSSPTGIFISLSTRALRQHEKEEEEAGRVLPPPQQVLVGPPFTERGPGKAQRSSREGGRSDGGDEGDGALDEGCPYFGRIPRQARRP